MRKFIEKVELERQALRVINSSLGSPQLCGLSEAAIIGWEAANRPARGAVAKKLLQISTLMLALCERSGGRYEAEHAVAHNEVTVAMFELASLVTHLTDTKDQDIPHVAR